LVAELKEVVIEPEEGLAALVEAVIKLKSIE
jgi:hypothetical protein